MEFHAIFIIISVDNTAEIRYQHADQADKPKEIYEKLGFREVERHYEYLSTDIGAIDH